MPEYDLLLHGGTVIDGSGAQGRKADVAVRGDRIATVAPGLLADHVASVRAIDATGLVVAPGFIDTHNHSDGWLLKIPHLVSKTSQGFTTEVIASDGISYAPVEPDQAAEWLHYLRSLDGVQLADYRGWRSIAEYMALLDGRNVQNTATQIPYANIRVLALGWGRAPADDAQLRLMRQEVRRGMEQGATGISTGLDYVAECFARTDEIVDVASAMAPWGGLYVTHVRYKRGVLAGVREAVEIGRRAGVPVHISHLKGSDEQEREELLDFIDRVAVHEVDFSFDVYPYLPGSTMLNSLLPYDVWEDGPLGVTAKLASRDLRRRFAAQLDDYRLELDQIRIAWVPGKDNSRYQGVSLAEFARLVDRPAAEAICDLLIEENLAVLCVFFAGDDRLVEPFLKHERFMIGSDGIFFADGLIHPRQYGAATRILGPLVRDRKLFSLETAVRKLSGLPAERFGLTDRGLVRTGAFADLVVFDPATVSDRANYDDPHQLSVGIEHVLVNGVPILRDGRPVEIAGPRLPGRALRFKTR